MDILQPWHLIVLAIVAFLIFGAKRLPELGKGLGEGLKGFREGIKGNPDPAQQAQAPVQQAAINAAPQSTPLTAGKANYRCPNCKNVVAANAPNPNVPDEKGFCPECGTQFDKKSALL
ncbi:MAG: twin-arginine translocase TatA/TatE family subunit [Terracidiphilus sp.]